MTETTINKSELIGAGIGIFFMAFFGLLWSITGNIGLQGWGSPFVSAFMIFIGIALMALGVSLLSKSRALPAITSKEGHEREKRINFWFNIIFLGEGVAIGITITLCNFINQTDLIPGIIALIVGIHFFPFARLFQVKLYHVTGALLCLLTLISFNFLSTAIEVGDRTIMISLALLGFGSALILWVTGLIIWITTKRYGI